MLLIAILIAIANICLITVITCRLIKRNKFNKNKWFMEFNKYCEKRKRNKTKPYHCYGYWCCNKCYSMNFKYESFGCVETIIKILKKKRIFIDYTDYDFKKWEKLAHDKKEN